MYENYNKKFNDYEKANIAYFKALKKYEKFKSEHPKIPDYNTFNDDSSYTDAIIDTEFTLNSDVENKSKLLEEALNKYNESLPKYREHQLPRGGSRRRKHHSRRRRIANKKSRKIRRSYRHHHRR
jgi:hypothetical protein